MRTRNALAGYMTVLLTALLLALTANSVQAQPTQPTQPSPPSSKAKDTKTYRLTDPAVGTFIVRTVDRKHPEDLPYLISLTFTCLDRRQTPNAVRPREEVVFINRGICALEPFEFNRDQGVLRIFYSVLAEKAGPSECSEDYQGEYDLRDLCAAWQQ
ncbi:MAG: hypothetical protein HC902_12635 [Calothrix sp. SM1_5_4]|nr:hypothetical protein [Calothrix sp. SM1_5_4]